jgi:hypothetical protein
MEAKLNEFADIIKAEQEKSQSEIPTVNNPQSAIIKDVSEEVASSSNVTKPVPDYNKLKEQSIEQQLIVREFFMARGAEALFGGKKTKKEVPPEDRVTIIDEHNIDDTGEFDQNLIFKIKETNEEVVRILPTVDSKSQVKIRRTIFYEKLVKWFGNLILFCFYQSFLIFYLFKSIEKLTRFSDFNYSSISSQLKNHVKNFIFSLK